MNLLSISWKNLKAKPLTSLNNLLLLSFAVGTISLVLLLKTQLDEQYKRNIRGIDMVVGAKGSPLQLLLSAVYQVDNPTGNIPLAEAEALAKHRLIKQTIPLAYGDNYGSFRIVGTEHAYIQHYADTIGKKSPVQDGRLWEKTLEATIGSNVAQTTGLKVGDTFFSSHGLTGDEDVHKNATFTVVGILKPTGSIPDQLILTEISSLWTVHGHTEADSGFVPEITAMMVKFRSPLGSITLPRMVNTETTMQAAVPAFEFNRLFQQLGKPLVNTIWGVALAIILISAISVFISLFNSLKDRKYELALMRSMGASPMTLFLTIVFEGLILAFIGYILGIILSRLGMYMLSVMLKEDFHYDLDVMTFLPLEAWLFLGTMLLGFLAALIPAINAAQTDIHRTLADN